MRSALSCLNACRYVPKHAAPRDPLAPHTRTALAVGLAAAMLPLSAGSALADDPASAPRTTITASAPQVESGGAASAVRPALLQATRRSQTTLSFSAPRSAQAKAVPVGIRLIADGRGVKNGSVRLERSTSKGWTLAGRLLTNADGVGRGTLKVVGSTKLRAAYTGSQVRSPAVSAARTVTALSTARTVRTGSALRAGADVGQAVLAEAVKHVGKPYVYGAVGPDSFDCSGFTSYVYAKAAGLSLPRTSRAQERFATPVAKADAQPGDLIFMQDVAGHVGIYAGGGRMYDAPRSGKRVSLRAIWSPNYTVGRVL